MFLKNKYLEPEFYEKIIKVRKSQWTNKSKAKLKDTLIKQWNTIEFRNKMLNSRKTSYTDLEYIKKLKESRAKQIFPKKDTKIEVKIQEYLKLLGIDFFTHQYIKEIEHSYQCDILIPSLNLVIECDGIYWHKYPMGNELDHIRTKELIEKGFKVLRLWEHEIDALNVNQFKMRLEKC